MPAESPSTTVAVFVGTRADLGPLSPVIEALAGADDLRLRVLTGVMYAADDLAPRLDRRARGQGPREVVRGIHDAGEHPQPQVVGPGQRLDDG